MSTLLTGKDGSWAIALSSECRFRAAPQVGTNLILGGSECA